MAHGCPRGGRDGPELQRAAGAENAHLPPGSARSSLAGQLILTNPPTLEPNWVVFIYL